MPTADLVYLCIPDSWLELVPHPPGQAHLVYLCIPDSWPGTGSPPPWPGSPGVLVYP